MAKPHKVSKHGVETISSWVWRGARPCGPQRTWELGKHANEKPVNAVLQWACCGINSRRVRCTDTQEEGNPWQLREQ